MKVILFAICLIFMSFLSFGKSIEKVPARREQSIIISKEGFYPQNIVSFVGEELKIFITSISDAPSCFLLPDQKIYLSVKKGEMVEKSIILDSPGEYKFYCPVGKISGKLIVLEREADTVSREIASVGQGQSEDSEAKIWRPKDFPTYGKE